MAHIHPGPMKRLQQLEWRDGMSPDTEHGKLETIAWHFSSYFALVSCHAKFTGILQFVFVLPVLMFQLIVSFSAC